MIKYSVEKLDDVYAEFERALMPDHWRECAEHKDDVPLLPDYEAFKQAENNGLLLIITVRDEGALIGYWAGFVRKHIHYKSTVTAHTDIFYLQPAYRARCARGLFKFLHAELKTRNVVKVFNRAKLETVNNAGRFLEAMGYELVEYGYSYFLGDKA